METRHKWNSQGTRDGGPGQDLPTGYLADEAGSAGPESSEGDLGEVPGWASQDSLLVRAMVAGGNVMEVAGMLCLGPFWP